MEKEKKEIWKLVELLNEYEIWKWKNGLDIRQEYAEHNFKYNKWLYIRVISKKFWFIKWLVENDKIDWDKVLRTWWEEEFWVFHRYDDYYCLLMLLSISSSPIEDLISYLK